MGKDSGYIDIRRTMKAYENARIKLLNESKEDNDKNSEAIPYTQQDELMQTSLETARTQFGAQFDMSANPMQYYPTDKDVILSGVVPGMNNLKFQFRLNDPQNGCYIWIDSAALSDEYLKKLNIILGVYKNWRQQLSTSEDIAPLSYKNKE